MKKLLFILAVFLAAPQCFANISVFPYAVDFDASSKKRTSTVRIINSSGVKQTYRAGFVNYVQLEDGQFRELTEQDAGAKTAEPYLFVSPRQFTLEPDKVQTINVIRRPAPDMEDGEYVSHLKITEIDMPSQEKKEDVQPLLPNTLSIKLRALYAITIPVTISKGKAVSKAVISGVQKTTAQDGAVELEVTLDKEGSRSVRGSLLAVDSKNKKMGELNNVRIYPAVSKRKVYLRLTKTEAELKGSPVRVIFKDKESNKNVSEKEISL